MIRAVPLGVAALLLLVGPGVGASGDLPGLLRAGPGAVQAQSLTGAPPPAPRPKGRDGPVRPARPVAVPYVAQTELLCGAAALAMVRRAWGERDVQPGDWAGLVRPEEGGIRTSDLAWAAAEPSPGRGAGGGAAVPWSVRAGPAGNPRALERAVAEGPTVVLLEDRPGIYHYVVVLEVGDDEVRYHDPAARPDVRAERDAFDAAWAAADRWLLLAVPAGDAPSADGSVPAPPADRRSPAALEASRHFRAGRWEKAARAAGRDAPRIRAASLFLAGRTDEALTVWSGLGAARLDLLRIEGLERIRHPVLHAYLDLDPRVPLAPDDRLRALRRLTDLPGLAGATLGVRPVEGGELVEVTARVVERPPLPRAPVAWAARALEAVVAGRARLGGGVTSAGEWLEVQGAWGDARTEATVRLTAPDVAGLPGRIGVEGRRVVERHGTGREHVASVRLEAADWATATLRWDVAVGADAWNGGALGPAGRVSIGWRDRGDRLDTHLRLRGGDGPRGGWARLDAAAALRGGRDGGTTWSLEAWAAATGAATPRTLWPGAGTGRARDHLLRAHALEADGRIAGPSLAPRMLGGTAEAVRWTDGPGPLRIGVAAFVDAALPSARAEGPEGSRPGLLVDLGTGLRLALPGVSGALRLDGAVGTTDGARALSAGWTAPWPGR